MKKIIFTLSIIGLLYTNSSAQKNHKRFGRGKKIELESKILSLETSLAQFEALQEKYVELYGKYNALRFEKKMHLDSINKLLKINSENSQKQQSVSNILKIEISRDEVIIDKQMAEYLRKIQFAENSYKINNEMSIKLNSIVDFLKLNSNVRFDIVCNSTKPGLLSSNAYLSQKRIDAVKNYFISKGIPSHRLNANDIYSEASIQTVNNLESKDGIKMTELVNAKEKQNLLISNSKN